MWAEIEKAVDEINYQIWDSISFAEDACVDVGPIALWKTFNLLLVLPSDI